MTAEEAGTVLDWAGPLENDRNQPRKQCSFINLCLPPCPMAGAGLHGWIMGAANRCRQAGLSANDTERIIAQQLTRPSSPPDEITSAVKKSYSSSTYKAPATAVFPSASRPAPRPITDIEFDPAKLSAMADKITQPANWRHWLWQRSLKRPETQNALSFIKHLYRDGEHVHVFDSMIRATPTHTVIVTPVMDCTVSDYIYHGGTGAGIWYLCNPVSGEWHLNPRTGKMSCRSEEAVTSFRYAVLESDQAAAHLWFAFLAQLPLRIAAIYSSGGRSIHCLIRVDARSKAEFDSIIDPLKRPFRVLGGDTNCLSAVRLTRLPNCQRPEKGGFQRLLYLCPNPPEVPLIDLPALWNRAESLARWKTICPRWSKGAEAFV